MKTTAQNYVKQQNYTVNIFNFSLERRRPHGLSGETFMHMLTETQSV